MEPEDTRRISRNKTMTIPFFPESSDNLHSVHEIQTNRRRRKRATMSATADQEYHHHSCSSESLGRTMFPSAKSSPASLVLFLLMSALLLMVCVVPTQSLPFDGRSLSSSSGSSSHRSHMDLLIDPIHQAEFGDDDQFENTRVVKSVFDMVLRTPPPPTSSSTRCPLGTQSPYEGAPCIKKSTDPVALVDQNFLLDTLRGLAKKGELLGSPQKSRRPGGGSGGNRRRPSGRPGSRTTSTTTTAAPSTVISSEEEELMEGEMSPSTTFASSATGDNFVNMAEEEVMTITQEPSTPSATGTTTTSASDSNEETVIPDEVVPTSPSSSMDQLAVSSDILAPETTAESSADTVMTTTTSAPTTTTEAAPMKHDVDLRGTAGVQEAEKVPFSSSATGNDAQITDAVSVENPSTTTASTSAATAETKEEQVKFGQDHTEKTEEQVPTIMTANTLPTPIISSQLDQQDVNNHLALSNQDHVEKINIQGDSQISLESQTSIKNQDGHRITHQPKLSTSPTSSSPITTSPQPTFPKEEFPTTANITFQAQADSNHQHVGVQDSVVVSSTTSPATITPSERMTTLSSLMPPNLRGAVGAENQVVTGVIPTDEDLPHHRLKGEGTEKADAQSQTDPASVAMSLEDQQTEGLLNGMMTTRMMKVANDETPQIMQDEIKDSDSSISPVISSTTVPALPQQPKGTPSSSTILASVEEPAPVQDGAVNTTAFVQQSEEEESTKVSDEIAEEGTSVPIGYEKVPVPLGPLEVNIQPETAALKVEDQEVQPVQVHDDEAVTLLTDTAGDISSMTRETEVPENKGYTNEEPKAGDNQPSSMDSSVVNHYTKDGLDDKARETVTLQVQDKDLPIINGNLPPSVSPVQDNPPHHHHHDEQKDIPILEDAKVLLPIEKHGGEISSSGENDSPSLREQEQVQNLSEERARDQPVFSVKGGSQSVRETTPVPPPTTTNVPGSPPKFQPSDTLLQFQLPIVTRVPESIREQEVEGNSFQPFPGFPPAKNPTKLRFPDSAEDSKDPATRATFKPLFVQDFHLDYPPRHDEQSPPPQQQWQVPLPFHAPDASDTASQQQTQPPILPEYYDTGSTEYLESELDRRHQKTRSRNRISNTQQPIPASTTNQPLLPPEISFYSQQQKQAPPSLHQQPPPPPPPQQQHHQPSFHFARRNPTSDFIPFGYLNFRTGHERFHHNNRRLIW